MRAAGLCICGALAVLAVCVSPTPAAGLEPGVHVSPGSPAEKEYVLPLNQARQTGEAGAKGSTSGLFGAGITPPGGSAGGASPSRRTARPGSRTATRSPAISGTASAPGGASLPAGVLRATRTPSSSVGSGSLLALLGGGLAVLVLGAFGGTVLRHSRRPPGRRPTPSG
jgi:hypothetical protein